MKKHRSKRWQSRRLPRDFEQYLVPALDARPYIFGPRPTPPIRTPQPDLWKFPPRRPQRRRCC